jgi:hypothetical protein
MTRATVCVKTTLAEVCELAAELDEAFARAAANPAARGRLVDLLWETIADLHGMAATHPFARADGIDLGALVDELEDVQ